MARIVGIDLPREKKIKISLGYLYGVGRPSALKILAQASVDPEKRTKDLNAEEVTRIASVLQQSHKVEGDLRREVSTNIKRLIDIGAYRGLRHRKGLPVRGQRTHTNARTRKGPRRQMSPVRKAAPAAAAPAKAGGK